MVKNKTLGIMALGILMVLGISLVAAYHGDYSIKGPDYIDERHDAMQAAFDDLDYVAWITLMSETGRNPRVLDVVTEDNFATFVAAHEAGLAGDADKAAELRAELGLNNGMGPKDGTGSRMGQGNGPGKGSMQGSKMGGQGNNGDCINN